MINEVTLLRWDEARNRLHDVSSDLILAQLSNNAHFVLLETLKANNPKMMPVSSFDVFFFLGVVGELCRDRGFLRAVLDQGPQESLAQFEIQMAGVRTSEKVCALSHQLETGQIEERNLYRDLGSILSRPRDSFDQLVGFVRFEEAMRLLAAIANSITRTLMHYSNWIALMGLTSRNHRAVGEFDLCFFTGTMERFFSNHDFLKRVLNGENLGWFPDGADKGDRVA
jgi:hypothetical protein